MRTVRADAAAPGGCSASSRQAHPPSPGRTNEESLPCSSACSKRSTERHSVSAACLCGSQTERLSGATASAASTALGNVDNAAASPNNSSAGAAAEWRKQTCSGTGSSDTSTRGGRSVRASGRQRASPEVDSCDARARAVRSLVSASSRRR
eukprot:scaffold113980_cov24-Tisochrysis_lutea.AAC.10